MTSPLVSTIPKLRQRLFLPCLLLVAVCSPGAEDSYHSSYYKDGELHVNVLGTPEGEPLTKGHWDFKPSWSKTGDRLVFFRRLKNDADVSKWKTAIHIINVDGSGLHQLTDGTHTDFNQTWTRDGTNTPIWNRKHPTKRCYQVMAGTIAFANQEGKPVWFAYPRWVKDESAIVYHAGGKLFLYTLADKSTVQVSTDNSADYRYPHGEATPK